MQALLHYYPIFLDLVDLLFELATRDPLLHHALDIYDELDEHFMEEALLHPLVYHLVDHVTAVDSINDQTIEGCASCIS